MCCFVNIALEYVCHHVLRCWNKVWWTDLMMKSREKKRSGKASDFKVKRRRWFVAFIISSNIIWRRQEFSANLLEWTAKATSVSRRTVVRIRHKKRELHDGESFTMPPKRYTSDVEYESTLMTLTRKQYIVMSIGCIRRKSISLWIDCW